MRGRRQSRHSTRSVTTLMTVRTPLGEGQILAEDVPALREPPVPTEAVRLLPSGDPYYLLWGADRELLVPDAASRAELWTTRVWPGAAAGRRRDRRHLASFKGAGGGHAVAPAFSSGTPGGGG